MNPHLLSTGHLLYNRYSIQKTLGQGGFGITYLAYDQKLEQEVCIKELFISGNSTRGANMTVQSQGNSSFSFTEFVDRFVQEAKQLVRFQHPNIVRVIDIFQENDTAYTVMEYVNGETLKQRVQRTGALEEKEAKQLINQLLDAVEAVHGKGMLHRDIKPENILISPEGRVVLIDFGSAREFAEGKASHQTVLITSGYAPPEQYTDHAKRGPFTDIYALGATLYYLLTGQKPLASTDRSLEELVPPQQVNSKLTSVISGAILKAMELKPSNRFQAIGELREALNQPSKIDLEKSSDTTLIQEKPKQSPEIQKEIASPTLIQATPKGSSLAKEKQSSPPSPKKITPKVTGSLAPKKRLFLVLSLFGLALLAGGLVFWYENSSSSGSYYYPTTSSSSGYESEEAVDYVADSTTAVAGDGEGAVFICANLDNVPASYANDGECDCDDCTDEYAFQCPEGKYILSNYLNDGDWDCANGADENQGDVVICKGGKVILSAFLNDGECDCEDCGDES